MSAGTARGVRAGSKGNGAAAGLAPWLLVQPPPPGKKKPPAVHDDVFFTIDQIVVGARLVCMGRLDAGTVWEVQRITTGVRYRSSGGRATPQRKVTHLGDRVMLAKVDGPHYADRSDRRETTFANLSYSAIWRLYPNAP